MGGPDANNRTDPAMASPAESKSSAGAPKARLSRELVLSTALTLVDNDGLEALSMRRLGQELQCDPMSLYRYAANRAALLDGVSEMVFDELAIFPGDPDWQAQLRKIAHDLRLLALRHPNVVPLLVTRPLSTPGHACATTGATSRLSDDADAAPPSPIAGAAKLKPSCDWACTKDSF